MNEKPAADALPLVTHADGLVSFAVRVVPRAPRTAIDGLRNGAILIRLSAPPVDGAANDALIAFLASVLECPRRQIRLVSGEKSRDKRIAVDGLAINDVAARLLSCF